VRVAVEGELYAGVPREVLDELGVHAPAEKQREARVPEIMPANIRQPCSPEQGLEVAVDDVLRIERCPLGGGEDESRVLVGAARPKLLLELALAVALEGCQRPLGKIYGSPGGVLGLGEDEPAGLAFLVFPTHPLQLAIDAQASAGEIYVRPLEPKGLAHPEQGGEQRSVRRVMSSSCSQPSPTKE
jgi:hypothetical protein